MLTEDYLMRMIKDFSFMVSALFGKRESYIIKAIENQTLNPDSLPELFSKLDPLLQGGKINEAENLLFEEANFENFEDIDTALLFYLKIGHLSDSFLESAGYDREEIADGLRDVAKEAGIDDSFIDLLW